MSGPLRPPPELPYVTGVLCPEYDRTRSEAKPMRKPRLENLPHTLAGRRVQRSY